MSDLSQSEREALAMAERPTGEQEAMVAACKHVGLVVPGGGASLFFEGWLAAREFYRGQGYTPRSMLRAAAHTQGTCPICSQAVPASASRSPEVVERLREALEQIIAGDEWATPAELARIALDATSEKGKPA